MKELLHQQHDKPKNRGKRKQSYGGSSAVRDFLVIELKSSLIEAYRVYSGLIDRVSAVCGLRRLYSLLAVGITKTEQSCPAITR